MQTNRVGFYRIRNAVGTMNISRKCSNCLVRAPYTPESSVLKEESAPSGTDVEASTVTLRSISYHAGNAKLAKILMCHRVHKLCEEYRR
jgi:hypothetical protein